MGRPRSRSRFQTLVGWAVGGMVVAAVTHELRRPADLRTWHGTVMGVPYDFRIPTWERLRERMWSPDDPHLITPHVFGLGWTVNLGRLLRLLDGPPPNP